MGIKLNDFIKDTNNVFTQEEAEMIYLASGYVDGVFTSNDEHYPPTENARKVLEMRIMIAKEWLEDIKERFAKYQTDYNLNGEDVEWLIQQAERVQELESELNKQIEIGYKFEGEIYDLEKENKRYREALKNIYELAEYNEYDNILEQIVSEIEKALEGTK